MSHPYRDLPDSSFWSRVVANPAGHEIDPVVDDGPRIEPSDGVATMGSCFAQHIARFLQREGLRYLVTEPGPAELDAGERARRGYGLFTARFGNVYTVRQANQLLARAFGDWDPDEAPWQERSGRWIDPFRPTVEPSGFPTLRALLDDRGAHLAAVRAMVDEASILVFTLGLTETWRSRRTGAAYPIVPGAAGGVFDASKHEFVNYGIDEVSEDLSIFCRQLHQRNPSLRILLTISPVPLIATYSGEHVLTATTYSKAVLRVAAAEAVRTFPWVSYFPSYEIITNPAVGNRYYAPDLRSVTDEGVAHVMRVFRQHYIGEASDQSARVDDIGRDIARVAAVVCDEEVLVSESAREP